MKVVKNILLILNIVAVAVFVLSSVVCYVEPSKVRVLSLAAFMFMPMLVVNVLFAVVWLLFGKSYWLLSVVAIALRCTMLPLYFQVGGSAEAPADKDREQILKVMTYNVHLMHGKERGIEPNNKTAHAFLTLVREEMPDVMALQEYSQPQNVSVSDSLKRMGYKYMCSTRQSKKGTPMGTVLYSKYPISKSTIHSKEMLSAEVKYGGKKVRIVSVHASSYHLEKDDFDEIVSIETGKSRHLPKGVLAKLYRTTRNHEEQWKKMIEPVIMEDNITTIFCGDINDTPSSYLYRQLCSHYADTYREKGHGFGTTYHAMFPPFRIDVVLHDDGLTTLSHHRLSTRLSDHYPIVACFEMK